MTFPAARKIDPVTHDQIVPSGVIATPVPGVCPAGPVVVEGFPAAHTTCQVPCTGVVSGAVAHPPPAPPAPLPLIVVGAATVFIHSFPAARWTPAPDLSACGAFLGDAKLTATRTVLIGGPSTLQVAIENLRAMLLAKLAALDRWNAADQADFQKWFGTTDAATRARMKARIERMLKLLDTYGEGTFKGSDNWDNFAHVNPFNSSTVYLGNDFGTAPPTGVNSQAGTLGHEMSHFYTVGATQDWGYGPAKAQNLASNSPWRAQNNADNFEYWLENAP